MSDAARETADRFHLLRLPNLIFKAAPARDIARSHHDAAHRDVIQQIVSDRLQPHPRAILMTETKLRRRGASHLQGDALERGSDRRLVVGMDEDEKTFSQQLRG